MTRARVGAGRNTSGAAGDNVTSKGRPQKDLFGNKAKPKLDKETAELKQLDARTIKNRAERLKYLESIYPRWVSMFGEMEPIFIFEEARLTFLNGAFISTILLCQAFIEHWLTQYLSSKSDPGEMPKTMEGMLERCRKDGLIHEYLVDRIDLLRRIRNPFTHKKRYEHPYLLSRRMFEKKLPPEDVLEQDAKDALALAHTLFFTKSYLVK